MGGEVRGVPEAAPLTRDGPGGGERIGAYLARQRRLRGISLDDLAELTKLPRRSLERLEAGAFDTQPDGFARGFVRTVADALGLDPEDAVLRLMGEPGDADDWADGPRLRPWLIAVGALVATLAVATGGLWLWRALDGLDADAPQVVYRRDAVRALAESVAAEASRDDREAAGD